MPNARHRIAVGLGSNLGDRQSNIAAALQRMRTFVHIERVSSAYETVPVGFAAQPDFLNLACTGQTSLDHRTLHDALRKVEAEISRRLPMPLGPRAIDLDLLLFDDLRVREPDLTIPHEGLVSRPFVLVPLAEIAGDWREPTTGKTIAELAQKAGAHGVRKLEGGLIARIRRDVQEQRPAVALALNRAGVSGVKTTATIGGEPAIVSFDVYADLDARRSGVHMSRFSQDLEDALGDLAPASGQGIDRLAAALAERIIESQRAERAEVTARAEFALTRHTPASALTTREFYLALARAVVTPDRQRRMIGVEAEGITACPCAQAMMAEYARERLLAEGFDERQIERILATLPIATHSQRGRGTLYVGTELDVELTTLVEILEQSMSSETYDLLKRPDELFVVNKAHRTPRFVEDVVREMLRNVHDACADLPDEAFVFARQVNFESIHKHDAVAESCMTVGELRRELAGEEGVRHSSLEEWLYSGVGSHAL